MKRKSPRHGGPQNKLSNLISPVRVLPILKPLQIQRNGTLRKTRPPKGLVKVMDHTDLQPCWRTSHLLGTKPKIEP